MEEGQAIESRMVSRRIEAAQKKVEERNFDIRKNLLEYDEVMDHQRKRIYGYRQEILERRQLQGPHPEHDRRADRRWRSTGSWTRTTAPSASREFAVKRLGVEFDVVRLLAQQLHRGRENRAGKGRQDDPDAGA